LRILQEENAQLKEALKNIDLKHQALTVTFNETSEQNRSVIKSKDELSSKYSTLEETYENEKLKWEAELARLRAEKAKLAENSDQATTELNAQWEEINASRDRIREEFKKTKEELAKQREELESAQKKLLGKLERTTKTKQSLEEVGSRTDESHKASIEVLRKHLLQHVADTNIWVPILEVERSYQHKKVKIPDRSTVAAKSFEDQLGILSDVMVEENKSYASLLREREVEEAEVLSVNMGKLKKRFKKPAEVEAKTAKAEKEKEKEKNLTASGKPDRPQKAVATPEKGRTPRDDAKKSPTTSSPRVGERPTTAAPHATKKADKR